MGKNRLWDFEERDIFNLLSLNLFKDYTWEFKKSNFNPCPHVFVKHHRLITHALMYLLIGSSRLLDLNKHWWLNSLSYGLFSFSHFHAISVHESFKKRKKEAVSQGRQVDDYVLFYEATGGKYRQGRAYGFGSTAKLFEDRSTNESKASGTQSNTTQVEALNDRVNQLEQVNARLLETNARLVDDVAEMRTLFQNLQGQLGTSSSFGRNPTSNNHVGDNLGCDGSVRINGDGVDDHDGYGFD